MGAGLCDFCIFQKTIEIRPGEIISKCEQSEIDHRFPEYPRLPVYQCIGYEARRPDRVAEDVAAERR